MVPYGTKLGHHLPTDPSTEWWRVPSAGFMYTTKIDILSSKFLSLVVISNTFLLVKQHLILKMIEVKHVVVQMDFNKIWWSDFTNEVEGEIISTDIWYCVFLYEVSISSISPIDAWSIQLYLVCWNIRILKQWNTIAKVLPRNIQSTTQVTSKEHCWCPC